MPRQDSVSQIRCYYLISRCAVGSELDLGGVAWPSVNSLLHQSELMMSAAATNVTLHFSTHLSTAGKSPQLPLVCSQ